MTHTNHTSKHFAQLFLADENLSDDPLLLDFGRCCITINSNSQVLLANLASYFAPVTLAPDYANNSKPTIELTLIETKAIDLDLDFRDWAREHGKTGKKDAFYNLSDGRIIKKVRTGMLFLQSEHHRIACGPCIKNESQVINFANMQYMIWLQHEHWLICHASAFVYKNKAIGVAAFSGGGKSTFMLKALDKEEINFLTNDRLFLKTESGTCLAAGIPKMPRVNPGTIINNPKLSHILSKERAKALSELPREELWDLEEKYDVLVNEVYGHNRIESEAPLSALIILNWKRDSEEPTQLKLIDINERRELLPAVMKSPGSFYPSPNGHFDDSPQPPDEQKYLALLSKAKVYEASGKVDFAQLKSLAFKEILGLHEQ